MTAPVNDLIRNAIQLDLTQVTTPAFPFVDDATTESGEPGGIFQTVWWWFYAYRDATGLHFTTAGSNAGDAPSGDGVTPPNPYGSLDTILNIYQASARYPTMASLSLVASNNNTPLGGGRKWSDVTFNITSGNYYFVQIGTPAAGYKGNVHLNYTGIPNSLLSPISGKFATFIDVAITTEYVDCKPGFPIPVQMPSGVQMGDQLVAFIVNGAVNPVSINGPSGWTGTLSTGFFTKTADGSEDGAILNWTTQDTTEIFNNTFTRPVVAIVACYRFVIPPLSEFRFFGGGSASAGSVLIRDIPPGRVTPTGSDGIVASTCLRVECAFGIGATPSVLDASVPLSAITWANPADRTGVQALDWSGGHIQSDGVASSVADIEYNFGPPFATYNPHDAVTGVSGQPSTAVTVYTAQYNFPGYSAEAAYWGINASTPF